MRTSIHLIRHGITEGNLKRWHYGWADIPLTKAGMQQLQTFKDEEIYPNPEKGRYYTSGMLRAEQTFNIIYGDKKHETVKRLKEMNFGAFEKKTYEELKDDKRYIKWAEDKSGCESTPDGESKAAFYKRVNEGFDEIVAELAEGEDGVCVCHGGVISCIMMRCFGNEEVTEFFKWIPEPGRGYTIEMADGVCIGYTAI